MKRSVVLGLCLLTGVCQAQDFPAAHLTPMGAERAANQDGSIPAWDGGYVTPATARPSTAPHTQDKLIESIDHTKVAHYDTLISPGQKALLQQYPETYRLPVYPSRRTAAAPQWVYDSILQNHRQAQLSNDGNGITDAMRGIPFPVPQNQDGSINPHKILWNHLTRWRGVALALSNAEAVVQENGNYNLVTTRQEVSFLMYHPHKTFAEIDNKLAFVLAAVQSPARLAGGAVLVHETLDRKREERAAWVYDAGSRRVRKAPNLAYDTPVAASDDLVTADMIDMFNGAPDRYEWRFIGKREMWIPYNNDILAQHTQQPERVIQAGHLNPEHLRYEKHRVWVIEAQLKPQARHLYSRRTFYIDEDTWSIVQSELYDSRGELWRVQIAYPLNFSQVPVVWPVATVVHDLQAGRYHLSYLSSPESAVKFSASPPPDSDFTQQALRRRGR